MDEHRKDYIREKGCFIREMWECSWCFQFKNNVDVKYQVRSPFPFNRLSLCQFTSAKQLNRKIVRLPAMRSECSRWAHSEILHFLPYFQKYWCYQKRYWEIYEDICGRKRFFETTATNVDIEFQVNQQNTYHITFQLLLGSWTTVYKNSSICTIHTE